MRGYLLCFAGVFCWSFSEITVKFLQGLEAATVGPVALSFYRFFFGGVFLLLLILLKRDTTGIQQLLKNEQKYLMISSMLGLGFSNVIYFLGIHLTENANVSSALYTTYPIFISIYGIFILGEKTNIPLKMGGLALGFFGTTILLTNFNFSALFQPSNMTGELLLLLAAAIWSLYSVLGKKIFRRNPSVERIEIKFTAVSFFYACIPILVILPFTSEFPTFFQHSGMEWVLILFMAIVITALGLYMFYIGVKKIEVSRGISMALMKPVLATLFSVILLHEEVPLSLYVSIPIVFIAVTLINWKPGKKEEINDKGK